MPWRWRPTCPTRPSLPPCSTQPRQGAAGAERLHRDRYHAAEAIYQAEVDPLLAADLVIDNSDIAAPRILSAGGTPSQPDRE